jgi:hypothetical protein
MLSNLLINTIIALQHHLRAGSSACPLANVAAEERWNRWLFANAFIRCVPEKNKGLNDVKGLMAEMAKDRLCNELDATCERPVQYAWPRVTRSL